MPRLALACLLLAAACSPQAMADNVSARAARSVVVPVMQNYMAAPQAEAAADCVMANASPGEIRALARDVGTRAGTLTVQNVATILRRPATAECLRMRGIGPVAG
ncbi:hypothetical protein D2N39_07685 [Gemmobacter lutimaris]|uniref:Succinate dehydrogenase n=1 Tax=Gemmobacter lutimaris TaxID=2306023 RepID=A0A398BYX8_9RHOB|nr:hypothetical protein [Gemmobacter lutimaris]RID92513.1 hypothetical protein D2N39_07685 [Gemmobacter lutimaris]